MMKGIKSRHHNTEDCILNKVNLSIFDENKPDWILIPRWLWTDIIDFLKDNAREHVRARKLLSHPSPPAHPPAKTSQEVILDHV